MRPVRDALHSISRRMVSLISSRHLNAMEWRGNFAVRPRDCPYAMSSYARTKPSDGMSFFSTSPANHCTTSSILEAVTSLPSTTSKPSEWRNFNCPSTELLMMSATVRPSGITNSFSISTRENATRLTFRFAVISLFNWRTEPLHKFRGFLYFASTSSIVALIFSKSEYLMTASPRNTRCPLYAMLSGTFWNTFALLVTTSPISPLPRVTAFTREPFS